MVMSKMFHRIVWLLIFMSIWAVGGLSAQELTVSDSFRGQTFKGTVDVSCPVLFDDCSFMTDSVVLSHSYGAVFRNCRFESNTGTLYIADSGSGIILVDCNATGCNELRFSRIYTLSDRNYVTGIMVNGDECSVLDDQETIIEIDGLELEENVRANLTEPVIMLMSADRDSLNANETAVLEVRGLNKGMFVGWRSSDPSVKLSFEDEFLCVVKAPSHISENSTVVISAYTEYGLEAACVLNLVVPEVKVVVTEKRKSRRKR